MTAVYLTDRRYVRFMAGLPGLWGEVGALDDPGFLEALTCERQALGLDAIDHPGRCVCRGAARNAVDRADLADRLPVRRMLRRARS